MAATKQTQDPPAFPVSSPRLVGRLGAQFVQEKFTGTSEAMRGPWSAKVLDFFEKAQTGSLAQTFSPTRGNGEMDIVKHFRWTLSKLTSDILSEVPYVKLKEFKCSESSITKQFSFFTNQAVQTVGNLVTISPKRDVLDPYKDIWPHDDETKFSYIFPYFNKVNLELATEPWQSLDSVGDSISKAAGSLGAFGDGAKTAAKGIQNTIDIVRGGSNLALNAIYPSVGVADRPKIFMAHNDRNINISFTLYNTFDERDWPDNIGLLRLIMSQNLFNKRDYTTGVPPVFYSVFVPGQYYCHAASMTNFKVENLGNQRLLRYGSEEFIVPDAFQVDITLTELVKPSKNQYEAVMTGKARKNVTVLTQ